MSVEKTLATLRPMTVADLDAVSALEVRAYSHPWSRGNFADSLGSGYLCELLTDADPDIEADRDTLCAYFVAMTGVDEMHLLNITVAPHRQGRGLGHALMQVVQARCRQRGLSQLILEVRESNHRARALYQRLGFAEIGLRRGYYPAGLRREDAVVMRLSLGSCAVSPALEAGAATKPVTQAISSRMGSAS